jgi:hypothetical protein
MKVEQMRFTEVQIFAFHAILVKRRDSLHSAAPSGEPVTWVDIGRPLATCTEVMSADSADHGRPRSTDVNPGKQTLPTWGRNAVVAAGGGGGNRCLRRSFLVRAPPARVAVVAVSAVARSKGLRQGAGVEEAPKAAWAIDLDVAAVA